MTTKDQIRVALEALKPFAEAFNPKTNVDDDPKFQAFLDRNQITPQVTMGDFRRAHEAYAALSQLAVDEREAYKAWHLKTFKQAAGDFEGDKYFQDPVWMAWEYRASLSRPSDDVRRAVIEECAKTIAARAVCGAILAKDAIEIIRALAQKEAGN
jgi:hypothetical protein